MSRKRKLSLKRGKFYASYPNGGHPALIYFKSKRKNKYEAVVFGTTPGKHRIVLVKPISSKLSCSVVHTRPIRGTRKDFGDKEFDDLKINKEDKMTIKIVKRRTPQETRRFKEIKKSR